MLFFGQFKKIIQLYSYKNKYYLHSFSRQFRKRPFFPPIPNVLRKKIFIKESEVPRENVIPPLCFSKF